MTTGSTWRTTGRSFGAASRTTSRPKRILIGVLILLGAWELAALWVSHQAAAPEYVMPDLVAAVRDGLPGLSAYYRGSLGGLPAGDSSETAWRGTLALIENGAISLGRVAAGLLIGVVVGTLGGLAMTAVRPLRLATFGVANLLRMMPLLALAPLMTLWLGAKSSTSVIFIAAVVALTMLIGTMNAVRNLDPDHLSYARTLGLNRFAAYRRVVLPGIIPELAATLALCGPLAWSVLLASELYGIQEGLGWMMGESLRFTLVARVEVIAAAFIALTFATTLVTRLLVRRLTRWVE